MSRDLDDFRFPAGTRCHAYNCSTGEEGYFVYGESPEDDEFFPCSFEDCLPDDYSFLSNSK